MLKEEHRELLTYKNITRDLLRQTPRYILILVIFVPIAVLLCFHPWLALLSGVVYGMYMIIASIVLCILAIVMLVSLIIYSSKKRYKVLTDYVVGYEDIYTRATCRLISLDTVLNVTFRDYGEYREKNRMLFTWSKGWRMPACHLSRYLHEDDECYIVVFKNKIYGVYPKSFFRLEGEPQKRSSFDNGR